MEFIVYGEIDINHMVLNSEVLGEQTVGTHLGFRGMAMDGFQSLNMKDEF